MIRSKLLFLILILASVLRLWNLSSNPPGLTWDEAALGYNAYSLLQTGKDEYGNLLPITLKSFGDFKPALYAYIDIPFIAAFGLNEFAVRLPSAIFGVLSVLLIYLLVSLLFKDGQSSFGKNLGLLAAMLLAINPISIQFSRPAFEASMALFLNLGGIYLFILGLEKKKLLYFSALTFGLSLLAYQASKIVVPLIIISLIIIYRQRNSFKTFKFPALILLIFLILNLYSFISGQTSRLSTQNFFAYQREEKELDLISREDNLSKTDLPFRLLHGEWWAYTKGLAERYLIYYSPRMLFIDGDYSQRHRVPDLGALYYFSVILIPLGLVYLYKRKEKSSKFILSLLLIAPLPAVLSRDLISMLRALNMVIPLVIIEAVGLYYLFTIIKKFKKIWFYFFLAIIIFVIIFNFVIYLDRYFIHAPNEYSKYWLYGYKQAYQKLQNLDLNKYSKIVFTDVYGQPYIYYLFYNKYSPEKFQMQAKLDQPTIDTGTIRLIDNIEFRRIYWPVERGDKNTLFIGSLEELPNQDTKPFPEYKILNDIYFQNDEHALRMMEANIEN